MKRCPKCNIDAMPAIHPGSQCTARRCQNCGWVAVAVEIVKQSEKRLAENLRAYSGGAAHGA